jgi:COP9 signalosome complex subunit 5
MSALALLKLLMHARKGGEMEVMGLLQGKFDGNTMIVMDVYALPVEGTETRVGAQEDAYEYVTGKASHISTNSLSTNCSF